MDNKDSLIVLNWILDNTVNGRIKPSECNRLLSLVDYGPEDDECTILAAQIKEHARAKMGRPGRKRQMVNIKTVLSGKYREEYGVIMFVFITLTNTAPKYREIVKVAWALKELGIINKEVNTTTMHRFLQGFRTEDRAKWRNENSFASMYSDWCNNFLSTDEAKAAFENTKREFSEWYDAIETLIAKKKH